MINSCNLTEGILVFISELTFHNVSLKRVKKTFLEKTEGVSRNDNPETERRRTKQKHIF